MAEVCVSAEQARRFVLSRQGLISPCETPMDAVRAVFGVQTQYAASVPTALAARTGSVCAAWPEEALRGGELVKSWTMRITLHTHSASDHALALSALARPFLERYHGFMCEMKGFGLERLAETQTRILHELAEGPLSRAEVHGRIPLLREIPASGWGMDFMGLALQGKVGVRGSEHGSALFGLISTPPALDEAEARKELVRRYLSSYGPAAPRDFAYWSGLKGHEVRPVWEALAGELTPVRVEGIKPACYVLSCDVEAVRAETADPPAALLPKFDPLSLGHREKAAFFMPEHLPAVFRKAGQVEAIALVHGRAAGTWRLVRHSREAVVRLWPFGKIARAELRGLEAGAVRLGSALGTACRLEVCSG